MVMDLDLMANRMMVLIGKDRRYGKKRGCSNNDDKNSLLHGSISTGE
jgi:hypothetical protein